MKRNFFLFIAVLILGIIPVDFGNTVCATYPSLRPSVSITVVGFSPKDDEIPDTPEKGSRIPSMRLPVTISMEGVEIIGVDTGDIQTYGIYGLDGDCMGIFTDGPTFAGILFSLTGEYELRFITDEYLYIGYVEL